MSQRLSTLFRRLKSAMRASQGSALLLLLLPGRATAQALDADEPRALRFDTLQGSVGAEMEGLRENMTLQGSTSTHQYLSLIPLVGLRAQGSVYHPNLMTFDFNGEGGYGWEQDIVKASGFHQERDENTELVRYLAQLNFLNGKPYNAYFFASQDHTFQNYDFFNDATVNSFRYGGHVGWTTDRLTLSLDSGYRDSTSSSLNGVSEIINTYVNFAGLNKRDFGSTSLTYNFDSFDNRVNFGPSQTSYNNSAAISDSETFGSRKQITATTGLSASLYEFSGQQSKSLHGTENILITHQPTLESFYNLYYDRSELDPVSTSVLQGMAAVRHRLYQSLVSTLDVHGSYDGSSGPGGDAYNDRYGVGLQEDYTKRLQEWGRLSMGAGAILDHEDHFAPGGDILTAINEPHTLYLTTNPNYRPAYLRNPRVLLGTVLVVGPGGIPTIEGLDYVLIPSGELTEVRLIQGSNVLKNGDTVLVTYQSDSLYNASYESVTGNGQIRLDLLNTFGLYGRISWVDNNAPAQTLAETLTDVVAGADATWRWFRVGGEYEDYDSTFNVFQSLRFFETFTTQPVDGTTFGIDLGQNFFRYSDGRRETRYQFLTRLSTQLTPWLWWSAEGGYSLQDVQGTEQNQAAARTALNCTVGNLIVKAGYQFNYQVITQPNSTEQRDRNFFFLHLKRVF